MSTQPKTTILVVDDEPRMVRFVKMNLDLEGYLTLEANNGFQALEKVRDHQPDLVLLDVEMPGMDGFETLRRIREVSDAAVIMLTVRSRDDLVSPDIILQGLTAGSANAQRLQKYFHDGSFAQQVRVPTENVTRIGAIDDADPVPDPGSGGGTPPAAPEDPSVVTAPPPPAAPPVEATA